MNRNRKIEIYNQAAYLFKTKGYAASSIRDIANAVGIEPSSLYSHIKSKEDILQKICFDCAERFTQGLDSIVVEESSSADKILKIIYLHISISISDPSSVTVFNDEWRHMNKVHIASFKKVRKTYEKSIIDIIKQGINNNSIKPVDIDLFLRTFLSSLKWIHHSTNKDEITKNKDRIAIQIHEIFMNGINNCT